MSISADSSDNPEYMQYTIINNTSYTHACVVRSKEGLAHQTMVATLDGYTSTVTPDVMSDLLYSDP